MSLELGVQMAAEIDSVLNIPSLKLALLNLCHSLYTDLSTILDLHSKIPCVTDAVPAQYGGTGGLLA